MLYIADLIQSSMRVARVLRQGESPSPKEMNDALQGLTIMLHSWSARKLVVRANVEESFVLTPNKGSYTIGVGGNFNTTKPYQVIVATIIDSNGVASPMDIFPKAFYQTILDKDISYGRPEVMVYDPGAVQQTVQAGNILLYMIPDLAYTLEIISQKPLTDFTSLKDKVTFDPMYEKAIKYCLARELWPEYHKSPVPEDIKDLAEEAMHIIESSNSVTPVAVTDVPGVKSQQKYNIYIGSNLLP